MLLVEEEGGHMLHKKRVVHMLLVEEEGGTYVVSGRRGWNICC